VKTLRFYRFRPLRVKLRRRTQAVSHGYLSRSGVDRTLAGGIPVEQWLDVRQQFGKEIIRWVRIHPERDTCVVSLWEVFDDRGPEFLDIVEFRSVDPDSDGSPQSFDTREQAVAYAVDKLGADPDRFVGSGMIQEEYAEHLRRRK
jgi:hypothetical protein